MISPGFGSSDRVWLTMRMLAFDTSSAICAVAVVDGQRVLWADNSPSDGRHGEVLLPRIASGLVASGVALSSIELIAVGVGPGSFTGLRIGLATAKGLALATATPLRGVCSLRVLARAAIDQGDVVVAVIDAGRGEVFGAMYRWGGDTLETLLAPLRAVPEAFARRVAELAPSRAVLCGGGARRYLPLLDAALGSRAFLGEEQHDLADGRHVAREALSCMRSSGRSDLASLEPVYLRDSDAKLPAEPLSSA